MKNDINNTQFFTVQKEPELQVKDVLKIVYDALSEKGYIRSIRWLDILCLEIRHILQAIIMPEALL